MIKNLSDFFAAKQEFFLDSVCYKRIDKREQREKYTLSCTDQIKAELTEDKSGVKLTVERVLVFEPEEIFSLSVVFGAKLKFNEKLRDEYDWETIDLEDEFVKNGRFVLGNLMSRISLLIGQITSSVGQTPLVLPPRINWEEEK